MEGVLVENFFYVSFVSGVCGIDVIRQVFTITPQQAVDAAYSDLSWDVEGYIQPYQRDSVILGKGQDLFI